MNRFLDTLSGKLLGLRKASAQDIRNGVSDNLIVTPLALHGSGWWPSQLVSFGITTPFSTKSTAWSKAPGVLILPPAPASPIPGAGDVWRVRLSVLAQTDTESSGEYALLNVLNGHLLSGSQISLSSTLPSLGHSLVFDLSPPGAYQVVLRRKSGSASRAVTLLSACLYLSPAP